MGSSSLRNSGISFSFLLEGIDNPYRSIGVDFRMHFDDPFLHVSDERITVLSVVFVQVCSRRAHHRQLYELPIDVSVVSLEVLRRLKRLLAST